MRIAEGLNWISSNSRDYFEKLNPAGPDFKYNLDMHRKEMVLRFISAVTVIAPVLIALAWLGAAISSSLMGRVKKDPVSDESTKTANVAKGLISKVPSDIADSALYVPSKTLPVANETNQQPVANETNLNVEPPKVEQPHTPPVLTVEKSLELSDDQIAILDARNISDEVLNSLLNENDQEKSKANFSLLFDSKMRVLRDVFPRLNAYQISLIPKERFTILTNAVLQVAPAEFLPIFLAKLSPPQNTWLSEIIFEYLDLSQCSAQDIEKLFSGFDEDEAKKRFNQLPSDQIALIFPKLSLDHMDLFNFSKLREVAKKLDVTTLRDDQVELFFPPFSEDADLEKRNRMSWGLFDESQKVILRGRLKKETLELVDKKTV